MARHTQTDSEGTPLPLQQRCPAGHLCGSDANYCPTCGAELDTTVVTDGGRDQCIVCGLAYDRDRYADCPKCTNDRLDDFGGGR